MTTKHPNAITATGSSIVGGELVVNIAKQIGWAISTGWGIAIAGALSGFVLFIGRDGLAGAWHLLIHGKTPPQA